MFCDTLSNQGRAIATEPLVDAFGAPHPFRTSTAANRKVSPWEEQQRLARLSVCKRCVIYSGKNVGKSVNTVFSTQMPNTSPHKINVSTIDDERTTRGQTKTSLVNKLTSTAVDMARVGLLTVANDTEGPTFQRLQMQTRAVVDVPAGFEKRRPAPERPTLAAVPSPRNMWCPLMRRCKTQQKRNEGTQIRSECWLF